MKIYRISSCTYIDDLSGTGASMYGGRWHSKGVFVLYTASSPSLALLESLVHITSLVSIKMCMICLDAPEPFLIKQIDSTALPDDWRHHPPPDYLQQVGNHFVKEGKYLALKVPSVIMPEEHDYIFNTKHNDFPKLKVVYNRMVSFDERLFKVAT